MPSATQGNKHQRTTLFELTGLLLLINGFLLGSHVPLPVPIASDNILHSLYVFMMKGFCVVVNSKGSNSIHGA